MMLHYYFVLVRSTLRPSRYSNFVTVTTEVVIKTTSDFSKLLILTWYTACSITCDRGKMDLSIYFIGTLNYL
jgi:hypothetical protein